MISQPAMLALGIGGAEAREVHPGIALHGRAQPPGIGCIRGGGEEFEVTVFQHHADVRSARGSVLRLLRGCRRQGKAERFEGVRGGAQVGNEMRDVVENQLAGGGNARGHVL